MLIVLVLMVGKLDKLIIKLIVVNYAHFCHTVNKTGPILHKLCLLVLLCFSNCKQCYGFTKNKLPHKSRLVGNTPLMYIKTSC